MANDKALLSVNELDAFKNYCKLISVGFSVPASKFQVLVVYFGGYTCVVTNNAKNVLTTPVELRPLIENFRKQHNVFDDTRRLDFMLSKSRKVLVENMWGHGYEVYVVEGVMEEKKYPSVESPNTVTNWTGPEALSIKRQAIDLAIANQ